MQWLRLAGDGDHRPGFAGRIIRLVGPQLAVEADSLELAGDRHALGAAQRYRDRSGRLGIFEPTRKGLPLRAAVADETEVEAAVGRVGRRGEREAWTDQRGRGELDNRKAAEAMRLPNLRITSRARFGRSLRGNSCMASSKAPKPPPSASRRVPQSPLA